jgi:hypothetical protein
MSTHAVLHMSFGGIGFLALIAACVVLARAYVAYRQRGWAAYAGISGGLCALGVGWAMSGGHAGSLSLFVGVVAAWVCVGTSEARISRSEPWRTGNWREVSVWQRIVVPDEV